MKASARLKLFVKIGQNRPQGLTPGGVSAFTARLKPCLDEKREFSGMVVSLGAVRLMQALR
jgi:hypothetical protein